MLSLFQLIVLRTLLIVLFTDVILSSLELLFHLYIGSNLFLIIFESAHYFLLSLFIRLTLKTYFLDAVITS